MTLDDLKQMDDAFITPLVASQILRCDPHLIRVQARTNPAALGFKTSIVGRRVKIPRLAFIRFIEEAAS